MNEELEYFINKLNELKTEIANLPDGVYHLGINSDYLDKLIKAITPPTADEVCKALSEYTKCKWKYIEKYKSFDSFYGEIGMDNGTIDFDDVYLPPHLITLIGKFYENEQGSDIEC